MQNWLAQLTTNLTEYLEENGTFQDMTPALLIPILPSLNLDGPTEANSTIVDRFALWVVNGVESAVGAIHNLGSGEAAAIEIHHRIEHWGDGQEIN